MTMKKFGLIGEVLTYSFSPQIHKAFFADQALEATYDLVEISEATFDQTIRGVLEGYRGMNVTIPYKSRVMAHLDGLDEMSRQIGAVNTVDNVNGVLMGYNTDAYGFLETLKTFQVPTDGARYVILGTGGAAKSVYHALRTLNVASIAFVSRRSESDWIREEPIWTYDTLPMGAGDVFVNTTPVGMASKEARSPIETHLLEGASHVVDLIYNPQKTPLLMKAEAMGMDVVNGWYMLVAQAIRSEEIWNQGAVDPQCKERIAQKLRDLMIP
jgi:shikimate dehydrogenase